MDEYIHLSYEVMYMSFYACDILYVKCFMLYIVDSETLGT